MSNHFRWPDRFRIPRRQSRDGQPLNTSMLPTPTPTSQAPVPSSIPAYTYGQHAPQQQGHVLHYRADESMLDVGPEPQVFYYEGADPAHTSEGLVEDEEPYYFSHESGDFSYPIPPVDPNFPPSSSSPSSSEDLNSGLESDSTEIVAAGESNPEHQYIGDNHRPRRYSELGRPSIDSSSFLGDFKTLFGFQMPPDVSALPKAPGKGTHPRTEEFLKTWRQDALNKHQYDAAIFIGDKLHALTGDPKDAFWLAQVHFSTGHYNRAQTFLTSNALVERSTSCRYLAALCLIKQSKYEEALGVLGDKNPIHLVSSGVSATRRRGTRAGGSKDRDDQGNNVKFEAAMCYLRGLVYAKQNAFDKAKDCYKCAVQIDVKCFEAFDQLMKNALMSPEEEWKFLQGLDFESLSTEGEEGKEAEFVKMLYTTRLSKYKNPQIFSEASEKLSLTYGLQNNADLIISRAELLFTQCKFKECLALCETVIGRDQYNFSVYPLYLACMHELNMKNKLFLVSHDMADNYPEEPVTWLAVGVYYLTTNKISEARRYFSKASMMDPHFGPAWIGFAHTFAAEGEHDQAISAYSTAARLFQGTHLPPLFLGMQHLQLNNITLADEYLNSAFKLCSSDPLLLNELGVVFYHKEALQDAVALFDRALAIANEIDSNPKAWIATRANLAHAHRKLDNFDRALEIFQEVVQGSEEKDAGVHSSIGLCELQAGRPWKAIVAFHEALSISPQDPVATELLEKALKENSERQDVFVTEGLSAGGSIVKTGPDEVDQLIDRRRNASVAAAQRTATARAHGHARTGSRGGRRARLGDVTRDFGGMEVSDDETF